LAHRSRETDTRRTPSGTDATLGPAFVEEGVSDRQAAGLYALALLPAAVLAFAASGWVMDATGHGAPGQPSGLGAWALNVLPPLAAGFAVYLPVARFVRARRVGPSSLGAHVRRSAVLYALALALGVLLLHDARRPEFWSLGQLVLWLWLVPVAGIAADAANA
jgi:hypothetical protein